LFQGDSITNAFRKPEEVCNAYQLGAGYAMMIAARILAARPGDGLNFLNRGVSGEGVLGLRKRWQADCLDLQPNVLSLLVGVNDGRPTQPQPGLEPAAFEQNYRELLQATRDALPEVRLVLCEPFVLPGPAILPRAADDLTARAESVNLLADEFDAAVVPLQDVFAKAQEQAPAEYWAFDGVHPTAQGHWLIAQAWLKAIGVKA
jgi:lysophospholipase L1-like esterase